MSSGVRIWQERSVGTPWNKNGKTSSGIRRFTGFSREFVDVTHLPSLAILAGQQTRFLFEEDPTVSAPALDPAKPAYRVPTMDEVRAIPPNGFVVASTFSGCGGNSTGYRMAGYRVAYANEFVPAARETYAANAAPGTVLDGRDVRDVTGAELLTATGLSVGEIDLFDGSPPCASFSTAGSREKAWGKVKTYSDTVQRSDDLFYEYARLIRETQPRTFVAENVSGLVKGTAKGYFKLILAELRDAGYVVSARVLDASWLGVPQARQRLIFVGVRADLAAHGLTPAHPKPLPYQYTVRDALPWIDLQARAAGFGPDGGRMVPPDEPSATFGASVQTGNGYWPPGHVVGAPDGNPTAPLIDPETGQALDVRGAIGARANAAATAALATAGVVATLAEGIKTAKGVRSLDAPAPTILTHANPYTHSEVALSAAAATPAVTDPETGQELTLARYAQAHGGTVRRLTLGELRALGSFPPDFVLTGSYAQRWERIGRAVPPVMMRHISAAVRDEILTPLREKGAI